MRCIALGERDRESDFQFDFGSEPAKGDIVWDLKTPDIVRRGDRDFYYDPSVNRVPAIGIKASGERGRWRAVVEDKWRAIFLALCAWSVDEISAGHATEAVSESAGRVR